ncbi:antitoxin VbhA family protein [Rhodococcus sp. UFZ-B548]|uniref:antitoxin VbhA family protein n=1 Tax=Rhodococcus sp. UFZ-B548 TaxID=2742212 RepID=UPI0015F736F0|nr:antitoxin VbhA family protein [Rhodococcus sp. UFZ-B548]
MGYFRDERGEAVERRQKIVERVYASLHLEGQNPTPSERALAEQYVSGSISSAELRQCLISLA